jgi:capsular polysaccharide biosynthesis protein
MKNPLVYYVTLAKRWAWMIVLGMVICSGATYAASKKMQPVYQASITFFLNLGSQSPYDNALGSEQAASTYAQLLTSSAVLDQVAKHRGLTFQQLRAMITVKPQTNTQLIELDVENSNPQLATQLANEISNSFAHYVNTGPTSATVTPLPVQQPTAPVRPTTLRNTEIGALVGLGLALALIVIFEWMDDRLKSPE